ncbi:hypothetical protein THAOC_03948 [Thalassiosira oceanica]|uniref:Dienelactone hydrolase domain-containing protein n=1 Tax=Thalassiosira oceanica TaxID=159749 RepID=K0TPD3_THAOC|nr:hypothetical protein THAOC_03948 [Thalassiosira oceanica]|eukprot:EJK74377.1 hypothetical protein THAOC_03948 [Thalassiosira oceanica]
MTLAWTSGRIHLPADRLCEKHDDGQPRLAKDEDYANAVLGAWQLDAASRDDDAGSLARPIKYFTSSDGTCLFGHVYRTKTTSEEEVPGIVLFHTGAGPQDVFLRWKADSIATTLPCVVLIADILSDEDGWAWTDRDKYQKVRSEILIPDKNGQRNRLAERAEVAIKTIQAQESVDPNRIAALGFCLGGHPIVELARMKIPGVKVLSTFHGVFDGVQQLGSPVGHSPNCAGTSKILINNGRDDPFVPREDLEAAVKLFKDLGHDCEVQEFDETRHGFTNPAQDFNPSASFAFSVKSNEAAMSAVMEMLKDL